MDLDVCLDLDLGLDVDMDLGLGLDMDLGMDTAIVTSFNKKKYNELWICRLLNIMKNSEV